MVIIDDASTGRLEITNDVDVGFGACLRVVPVVPEMYGFDRVCPFCLYKEDLTSSAGPFKPDRELVLPSLEPRGLFHRYTSCLGRS